MWKHIVSAAVTALALGLPAADPAGAQMGPNARPYIYGRPGTDRADDAPPRYRPPPPPADFGPDWPPPPDDADDRPRPRWRYRTERRREADSVCVTARGTCLTRAAPPDTPCGCGISGFGHARGRIED
ncbi:hypothetical protein [Methylobacterium sp. P5_C11]